jgi:hypothetical protein
MIQGNGERRLDMANEREKEIRVYNVNFGDSYLHERR